MKRTPHTPAQVINKIRETDDMLSSGPTQRCSRQAGFGCNALPAIEGPAIGRSAFCCVSTRSSSRPVLCLLNVGAKVAGRMQRRNLILIEQRS
jgi:hypothetical protein